MNQIKGLSGQQGYLTLISVVLIVIVGFIAVALSYIAFSSAFATINLQKSTSALYIAESGLQDGAHELATSTVSNRIACSGLSLTNTLGSGTYTVTSTGPFYISSPTTLNGALTASATTITVTSTTGYQSSGRIMIDKELIDYSAMDATHFLFAERGKGGTSAATHATATPVGQYQCRLTSTGGDPKLTYSSGEPGGKRILNEVVQLQEAWAVGNASGSTLTMARWNRPTEAIWNYAPATGNFAVNGISMNSFVDGWAVGASTTFVRWNGSAWNSVASGLPNVTYNDVYCTSRNACHVVGNMTSSSAPVPTIATWNGTSWVATTTNVGGRSGHQLSVHCATPTDCWSVGNAGSSVSTSRFYRWNGTTWSGTLLSGFTSGDFPFNGVSCPSTTSCWAVGRTNFFARWNGSTWTRTATGMPNTQYNGIHCNSTNDCWAVGNSSGGNVLIVHWDGTAWSRDASNPTPVNNLNDVACANSNDCWAVGASSGGEPSFYHWNGDTWSYFLTTGLPNVNANSIAFVGTGDQPTSTWSESFG